jgi:hypothetical protein
MQACTRYPTQPRSSGETHSLRWDPDQTTDASGDLGLPIGTGEPPPSMPPQDGHVHK